MINRRINLSLRVVRRLIQYRRKSVTVLVLVGFFTSAFLVGLSNVEYNARLAVFQGVLAQRGAVDGFIVQTSDSQRTAMDSIPAATAVVSVDVTVTKNARKAPGDGWILSNSQNTIESLELGRRPRSTNEVTLSEYLASTLDVSLGDRVVIQLQEEPAEFQVVGTTRDPSSLTSKAVTFTDANLRGLSPSYWMIPQSPDSYPSLRDFVADGSLPVTSNRVAALDAAARLPQIIAIMRNLPAGLGVVFALLQVACLMSFRATGRRDVSALGASGMSPRHAWIIVGATATTCVALGSLAGAIAAIATLAANMGSVSSWFGQDWIELETRTTAAVVLTLFPLLFGGLIRPSKIAIDALRPRIINQHRTSGSGLRRSWISLLLGAGLFGAGCLGRVLHVQLFGLHHAVFLMAGLFVLVISSRRIFDHICCRRTPPARRRVVSYLAAQQRIVLNLALIISMVVASYSALVTHDANALAALDPDRGDVQGAYVLYQVPTENASRIAESYQELGGHGGEIFELPTSKFGDVRVTQPECKPQTSCSQAAPVIGFIGLSRDVSPSALIAQGSVTVLNQVNVVTFSTTGEQGQLSGTYEVTKKAAPGDGLPSLIVSPDSALARKFDLRESGFAEVVLYGFSDLPPEKAAQVRAVSAGLAPSALVSEPDDRASPVSSDLQVSREVAFIGTILSAAVALVGLGAVLLAGRDHRTNFFAVNPSLSFRLRAGAQVLLPSLTTFALSCSGIWIFVKISSTVPSDGSLGLAWGVPLVVLWAIEAVFVASWLLLLPTQRSRSAANEGCRG